MDFNEENKIIMKLELQCGDTITIPKGCKAVIKYGCVVFEKEEKEEVQEFKDGDVLIDDYESRNFPCNIAMIYKGTKSKDGGYKCYISRNLLGLLSANSICCNVPNSRIRHATEDEKQQLFNQMKEQGLRWNAEEKRVEKIRWRAEYGKDYYYIGGEGLIMVAKEGGLCENVNRYDFNNYFRTREQAEEAVRLVKETLRKYHEEIGE